MNRSIELINLRIDRNTSEDETQELDSILARSPETRETLEAYEQLAASLDRAREVALPPDLKQAILTAIDRQAPQTRWSAGLLAGRRRRTFAFGSLAAAAALVALFTVPVLRTTFHHVSPHDVSGAMHPRDRADSDRILRGSSADGSLSATVRWNSERISVAPAGTGLERLSIHWDPAELLSPAPRTLWKDGGRNQLTTRCINESCPQVVLARSAPGAVILTLSTPDGVTLSISIQDE